MGVRRAVEGDLEAIRPLLGQLMPAEPGRRRAAWSDVLAEAGDALGCRGGRDTRRGFIDLVVFPDVAHGGTTGLINTLVVDARCRGRGLGGSLLGEASGHCAGQGVVELHVWTDVDSARAIALCGRLGFVRRALLLERQT